MTKNPAAERRRPADWMALSIAVIVLTFDLAVVPTAANLIGHGPGPAWLGIGLLLSPLLVFVFTAKTSFRYIRNRPLALVVCFFAYCALVTAHWIAIYVLGKADPPPDSLDNGPQHGLFLGIAFSYFVGLVLTVATSIFVGLAALLNPARR